jgi:hypothetical protein
MQGDHLRIAGLMWGEQRGPAELKLGRPILIPGRNRDAYFFFFSSFGMYFLSRWEMMSAVYGLTT